MRWLIDECMDAGLVARMREHGHDVVYVMETAPAANDSEVMRRAQFENRILLTEDKDFGDLVFRRWQDVPGIILSRIDPTMHSLKWRRLTAAIERFGENLYGRYTILEEDRFRSRPLRKSSL